MCGISGIVSLNPNKVSRERLKNMTDSIAHRGPDGEGHWLADDQRVGFGHRRLSILDLSESANQPMHFADRYTIVFNGEIYNYLELKASLIQKGYHFKTTSDTEVLMACYHEKKEKCLQELDGMFAFAVYDKVERTVFCARDRFGEKPFYYTIQDKQSFLFASEMKALWAAGVARESNTTMLYNYLTAGFLEDIRDKKVTFFKNIFRLPAASYIYINIDTLEIVEKEYWDIDYLNTDEAISLDGATQKFKELFYTSVKRRLRSDVPVGSSLSGGLDSSLVVSVMDDLDQQQQINRKTFSAQFPGFLKDESVYQQMVIDHTHVDPHFVQPTEHSMLANLDKIIYHQEEPFGSASIAVQYEVFELAKHQGVTVLLDGQGADEILGGYHGYFLAYFNELEKANKSNFKKQWEAYQKLHQHNLINSADKQNRNWKTSLKSKISLPVKKQLKTIYRKINPLDNRIGLQTDFAATYRQSAFQDSADTNNLNAVLYHSTRVHGLEQLLRYADRNSMAHSREVRLPFLNHELVEFLFTLPASFKINAGWTKYLMRHTFEDLLPKEICWRVDKIGYEPPQQKWLQNNKLTEQLIYSVDSLVQHRILDEQKARILKNKGLKNLDHAIAWKYLMAASLLNKNLAVPQQVAV
ncbi:asparagine synthase (glutamine-hydrolyzing) [Adhaeribacter pallidiroseus]|uniref:asparagine synthase (glutamine-hydrolyzing) n=1 Tax=Adhaeribacter pallidiroseus TaxID=2072847 RepID=A0A369QF82_9BACT|nr:asparagine synthase (glutamine-hydrolyzing) [Adhaeribacter pallidiroseus]RDC62970.1 Asparagine synthase (glutamine-hydrolyzing) [Adhaeribacter pallidiroseus]